MTLHAVLRTFPQARCGLPPNDPQAWAREIFGHAQLGDKRRTQRLHWRLWTNESVASVPDALRIVEIYKKRWKIEDFHLVLKDGCRVEALRLHTAQRLAKALVLYGAVALRLVQLRDLGRLYPEEPCTRVLSEPEWKTLWMATHRQPLPKETPVPTLRQAILWIGRLGGHLGRKSDGMPGVRVLWRGWRVLQVMAEMFDMLVQH